MDARICILTFLAVVAAGINITYQQQCVINLDVIIAFDGSNSMGQNDFQTQKKSIMNMLSRMNISDGEIHIGLILFSGDISAVVELTGDKNRVIGEIDRMRFPDEETNTHLAIDTAVAMFGRGGRNGSVPQLLIIVTDGIPSSPDLTVLAANRAKGLGINIYAIGVTNRANIDEMKKIASVKNKDEYQVFVTENFATLEDSLNNATNRACVDLKCKDAMIDIVFVLDSSIAVGSANFQDMKNFVQEFLWFADVDSGNIRVGIVTYSDTASVQFHLNTYSTKSLMSAAMNSLQYTPGANSIAEALSQLRTNMFTRNNGDRSDVPNVVIFLSANDVNTDTYLVSTQADLTRAAGVQIYGVGIGHASTNLMDGIVSRPLEETRFMINGFSELRNVIPEVYNKFNKFCESPPPVPACYMGITDLWLVVDLSATSERLSRFQYTGDYAQLKDSLNKMVQIMQDPSVSNPTVRLGLVGFSDSSRIFSDVSQYNSVNNTALAIQQLPGGIAQGGAALVSTLQNIVTRPVVSNFKSYVAIVAPESSYINDMTALNQQMTRLKSLGYTIVIFAVRENGMLDQQTLQREASGPQFFYYIPRYTELEAATKNFTRDRLCNGLVDNSTGLCAESGFKENGVGVVAHPIDCDKYIQCYYNQLGDLELGVVRQCPMGLHWNSVNKTCSKPNQARCGYDQCKESCEPYKMAGGSCGAYWDCEDGVSVPKCCPENYTFVSGMGCQRDNSCKDLCGPVKYCGGCQKKPNWENPAGYDVMIMGGNMWMPRPCFYEDFDIVDCDCTAPRDQVCPADHLFDFSDAKTRQAIDGGNMEGIRVYDVIKSSEGIILSNRSSVHVNVNHMQGGNEPFALKLRFRELDTFSPYGETLVSSGFSCGNSNSLHISANDQFIIAEIRSSHYSVAEVKVPLKGLNRESFKDLVLSYDNGVLALSIKDDRIHYVAKSPAPSNICLACGLDIGRGLNKLSFDGEIQQIAVYSCPWSLLY